MKIFCISVRTGFEEKNQRYRSSFKNENATKNRKRIFLKVFFGYVFFETDETDTAKFRFFKKAKFFLLLAFRQRFSPIGRQRFADYKINNVLRIRNGNCFGSF